MRNLVFPFSVQHCKFQSTDGCSCACYFVCGLESTVGRKILGSMDKEVIGNRKNHVELSSPELARYYSVDEMGDTWGACGEK